MSTEDAATTLYKRFGAAMANARRRAGKRQAQLAVAVGLSRTSVANIEAGRQHPKLYLVYVIARELNVEINELLPAPNEALWNAANHSENEKVNIARESWIAKIKQTQQLNEEIRSNGTHRSQNISPESSGRTDKETPYQARTGTRRTDRDRSRN